MPERLKAARNIAKLTQQQAADSANMQRTQIALLETGKRRLKDDELGELSKLYGFSPDWLMGIEDSEIGFSGQSEHGFPTKSNHLDKEDQIRIRDEMELFAIAYNLGGSVGLDRQSTYPPSYNLKVPSSRRKAIVQGEYYAEIERRRLGLGQAPIGDVVDFLMDQGIWFSMVEMNEDVSGVFIDDLDFERAIVTNSKKKCWSGDEDDVDFVWLHYVSQRLSAVHQYAHALFGGNQKESVGKPEDVWLKKAFGRQDWRAVFGRDMDISISAKSENVKKTELRADSFAGAFLLPKRGLDEELRRIGKGRATRIRHMGLNVTTGNTFKVESRLTSDSQEIGLHDIMFIANRFGVSYKMAITRLAGLGYISQQQSDDLRDNSMPYRAHAHKYSKLIRSHKRDQVPDMPSLARSKLQRTMVNILVEARRVGQISDEELREYAEMIDKDAESLLAIAKCVANTEPNRPQETL